MEKRQMYILKRLTSVRDYVTGSSLAEELFVSSRTIRSDIKQLNEELATTGAEIKSLPGVGYRIEINDAVLFAEYAGRLGKNQYDEQTDRQRWLIEELFYGGCYLKLEEAAEHLFVSRSTLSQDIRELKSILGSFSVTLMSRPNYGLFLSGEEYDFRSLMLSRFPPHEEKSGAILKEAVKKAIFGAHFTVHPDAAEEISQYISIAIRRSRLGFPLARIPVSCTDIRDEVEYGTALDIAKHLRRKEINLTDKDVLFITLLLIKHRVTSTRSGIPFPAEKSLFEEVESSIDELLDLLSLSADKGWRLNFAQHLLPALKRAQYGISIKNEIVEEIKLQYPDSFNLALRASALIEKKFGFVLSEDEAGFLALHFHQAMEFSKEKGIPTAVMCISGIGSAQILKIRLERMFTDELNVVGIFDIKQMAEVRENGCKLLISTLPLRIESEIPSITVSPLLKAEDKEKIRQFIRKGEEALLRKELFFRDQLFEDADEAIRYLAGAIIQHGFAPEKLVSETLEREQCSATAFGGNIALPHPLAPCGQQNVMAIALLKHPVQWGNTGEMVQIVFMLSLKKNNDERIQDVYEKIVAVMEQPSLQQKLLRQPHFEGFKQVWNSICN